MFYCCIINQQMYLLFTLSDNMIVNIVQFVQKVPLQNLGSHENWPKCARKIWNMLENVLKSNRKLSVNHRVVENGFKEAVVKSRDSQVWRPSKVKPCHPESTLIKCSTDENFKYKKWEEMEELCGLTSKKTRMSVLTQDRNYMLCNQWEMMVG